MAVPTFASRRSTYWTQWRSAVVEADRIDALGAIAKRLIANKARYQAVEKAIGVPWFFIACIHQREASGSFAGVLHNGERIIGAGRKTRLEPSGRGPFGTWEASAIDALRLKGLDQVTDWSPERFCYEAERYNGWGYFLRGVPSAYVWSFTSVYRGGKYIADHVWSATAMDAQAGVVPILKAMMVLDKSIRFNGAPVQRTNTAGTVAASGAAASAVAGGAAVAGGVPWAYIGAAVAAILIIGIIVAIVKSRKG